MSAILVLLGFSLLGAFGLFNGGEDDDNDRGGSDQGMDDAPSLDPDDPAADRGAVVTDEGDGTVTVTLGDDETGSLVLFNYSDSEDVGIGLSET